MTSCTLVLGFIGNPIIGSQDGLLYSEAEKRNAAYLLQLVASGVTAGPDQLAAPLDVQERFGAPMPLQSWQRQLGEAAETLPGLHLATQGASLRLQPPPWTQHPQQASHGQYASEDPQRHQQPDRALLQQSSHQRGLLHQRDVEIGHPPGAPHLERQEQGEQERGLDAAVAALQEATRTPLVPSRQQELARSLQGPQGAALAARLAGALEGGGGDSGLDFQPGDMGGLTEHNSILAAEVSVVPLRSAKAPDLRTRWLCCPGSI